MVLRSIGAYNATLLKELGGDMLPAVGLQPPCPQNGSEKWTSPTNFDLSDNASEETFWRTCPTSMLERDGKCAPVDQFLPFRMLRFRHLAITLEGIMGDGREIINVNRHAETFTLLRRVFGQRPLYFLPSMAATLRNTGSTIERLSVFWSSLRFLMGSAVTGAHDCIDGYTSKVPNESVRRPRLKQMDSLLNPLHTFAANYYHFLAELLPMLLLSLPWANSARFKVLMYNTSWGLDYASVLGITESQVEIFDPCVVYSVDTVWVPLLPNTLSISNYRGWLATDQLHFLRASLLPRAACVAPALMSSRPTSKTDRRVPVLSLWLRRQAPLNLGGLARVVPRVPSAHLRSWARIRLVDNSLGVLRVLQNEWRNVSKVFRFEASSHTVQCQMALFMRAAAVVGVEGAHFANTIWCSKGTLVILLMPSHGGDSNWCGCGYFQRIAMSLDLRYYVAHVPNFDALGVGSVPLVSFRRLVRSLPFPGAENSIVTRRVIDRGIGCDVRLD